MKKCTGCCEVLSLDRFPFIPSRNRHGPKCRECKQAYDRAYWEKTKTLRSERKKVNAARIRERNISWLLSYLQSHPCVLCEEEDPLVLEFDHLDPSTKESEVSLLLTYSIRRIEEEIRKCRVLCANCHRRFTAEQRNYRMWQMLNPDVA